MVAAAVAERLGLIAEQARDHDHLILKRLQSLQGW